jgi:hypothetical protein
MQKMPANEPPAPVPGVSPGPVYVHHDTVAAHDRAGLGPAVEQEPIDAAGAGPAASHPKER